MLKNIQWQIIIWCFDHNLNQEKKYRLLQGFIDRFPMPVSRYTEVIESEIKSAGLEILAFLRFRRWNG